MSQPLTAILPPARQGTDDAALDRLLNPSRFYERPRDVLRDDTLPNSEKRAILSSWASDACAVDSCPALRHPPFASQAVSFDEVMEALAALDRGGSGRPLGDGRANRQVATGDLLSL
ncbi:hypothetical protein [Bosea psychrotolerans]|uniref:Uncharacterized protein n=1 Tax=Bosea psychrotolerans TaxID=1871628 RepID=A0A2S4MKG7_9HYPH|nr:hypothetical protein [Bosea psychrotolerans]POR55125.1 hypothetical protein CYD53_1028 [Bosea psychrotolerans]